MLARLFQETSRAIHAAGLPDGRREAAVLIAHVLKSDFTIVYTRPDLEVSDEQLKEIRAATCRRTQREPLAYITGSTWFMNGQFAAGPGVLIPRPDSEILAEKALSVAEGLEPAVLDVLDACAGTGCVGISVAAMLLRQNRLGRLMLTEIDPDAAGYAARNLARYPLEGRAELLLADLLPDRMQGYWHLILANPPYIRRDQIDSLMPEVSRFEPRLALDGGLDGLDFYRRLIGESPAILRPGGVLLLEHGYDQAEAVASLFIGDGRYELIAPVLDYGGQPRVSGGYYRAAGGPDGGRHAGTI